MSTALKEKKQIFKIKDISNDGIINQVKESTKMANIKTEQEKHHQNKDFIKTKDVKENNYKERII